jgi:hypothetical membrane protein
LTRWLALAGLVGPAMYVLDVTLVGLARPGYSVISQAVSELGGGPDGWQLNFALIALGVLLTSFTVGFFRSLTAWSGQARRWVCAGLLMLPSVGFAMAGIYPLPNPLHWLLGASLVFLGSIPAFFVSGFWLRRELAWRGLGTYAVVAGWLTLLLVVLLFGIANPSSPAASIPVVGLVERVLVLEMLAWYAVVGWQIFRKPAQG